ncbi:MAG: DUF2155 domain-containing protein [Rickettsiales bacterium]|jgi:hypothetical protein|nr:DUF2155 domain-containing protein [Rickettsiales bacterium]
MKNEESFSVIPALPFVIPAKAGIGSILSYRGLTAVSRFMCAALRRGFISLFILHSSFLILISFFIASSHAEVPESEYIVMETAIVQAMNKAAGKTQTLKIPVGKTVRFDKLEITVEKCLGTDEFLPENFYMFAVLAKGGREIFSGWMIKSEPGYNPLQDPDNDLWLVRCE